MPFFSLYLIICGLWIGPGNYSCGPGKSWIFYPRDAMRRAVPSDVSVHLSVCWSVHYSRYCMRTESHHDFFTVWQPMISTFGKVWLVKKFARGHPEWVRFMRLRLVQSRTADFGDFSTYKPPYLRNGARYDQGYYWTLIGNGMQAFDWYQNQRPWMTLKWPWPWAAIMLFLQYTYVFQSPPQRYEWR